MKVNIPDRIQKYIEGRSKEFTDSLQITIAHEFGIFDIRRIGTVVSVGPCDSGALRIIIRADDLGILRIKPNRFFGHEKQFEGHLFSLKMGDKVSFLPAPPRKKGQLPQATQIRLENLISSTNNLL